MLLALFASICQLTRRSSETWIIMKLEIVSIIFLFQGFRQKFGAKWRAEREKKKGHFFGSLLLRRPHYLNACYLTEQARSSSFSTTPKIQLTQEPISRSEQLPCQAYVTAFLRTSLFLDTFQGTFSRENRISTMSMSAFEV